MTNLLRADFTRLRKSKLFYAFLAGMAVMGAWVPLMHYRLGQRADLTLTPDSGFCTFGIPVIMLLSALVPLLIGVDYSDGTIRNKIVVGRGRGSIYLSKLCVCLTALLLLDLAFLAPFLSLALPLLGSFMFSTADMAATGLYTLLMEIALTALYVFIAMLCQSRAYSAVLCIALCAVMIFAGMYMQSNLDEPEIMPPSVQLVMGENGLDDAEFVEQPEKPNPHYVGGATRQVMEFFYEFLPGGQAIELSTPGGDRPWTMPLYSGLILVLSTCAGLLLFQKKDLK